METMIEPKRTCVLLESFPDDLRGAPLNIEPSKIIVPGMYAETSRYSVVIAVGCEVRDIQPGWVVLSTRYPKSAWSFQFEGREFVSVEQDEILARINLEKREVVN
jgi:hypothetical protein